MSAIDRLIRETKHAMRMGRSEQRAAPRVLTDCVAELALGSAVARVVIRDMSVQGCGAEVIDAHHALEQRIGAIGLISVALYRPRFTTMLCVQVRNVTQRAHLQRFGLQFMQVTPRELGNITGLLELVAD